MRNAVIHIVRAGGVGIAVWLAASQPGCGRGQPSPPASAQIVPGVSEDVLAAMDTGDLETLRKHREALPTLAVHWHTAGPYPVLNYACRTCSSAVVRELLDAGCPIKAKDVNDGLTPLGMALNRARKDMSVEVFEMLLDAGASPIEEPYEGGATPLWHAVIGEHNALVQLFLARGADPFAMAGDMSVMQVAVVRCNPEVVTTLTRHLAHKQQKVTAAQKKRVCAALRELQPNEHPGVTADEIEQVRGICREFFGACE